MGSEQKYQNQNQTENKNEYLYQHEHEHEEYEYELQYQYQMNQYSNQYFLQQYHHHQQQQYENEQEYEQDRLQEFDEETYQQQLEQIQLYQQQLQQQYEQEQEQFQQEQEEPYGQSQQYEIPIFSLPAPIYHYPTTRGQLVQYILDQEAFQNPSSNETKEFVVPTRQISSAYPCEICHQIFRKKTLLRTHKLSAHGVAEYRCGKFFFSFFSFVINNYFFFLSFFLFFIFIFSLFLDQCHKIFTRKSKLEHHKKNDGIFSYLLY